MSRRARPTLRVLREDLQDGWTDPAVRRHLDNGDVMNLLPLVELPHPALLKASECFGDDPALDNPVGVISSVTSATLYEVKVGQWRAAVLTEESACWVVAAGLAKGEHEDHGDFYEVLDRAEKRGAIPTMQPSTEDVALWRLERAHRILMDWQVAIQAQVTDALRQIHEGGTVRFEIPDPRPSDSDAPETYAIIDLTLTVFDEASYRYEEIIANFSETSRWRGSELSWHIRTFIASIISPPEQSWQAFADDFSTICEVGETTHRIEELHGMNDRDQIATSAPGAERHYTHARSLADRSIDGETSRALCGVWFVPRQDWEEMGTCPRCHALYVAKKDAQPGT